MDSNDNKNKPVDKIIVFPVYLLSAALKSIREKIEFSIHLKLSFRYIKILAGAMLGAGLGVILISGALNIFDTVSRDHQAIKDTLSQDGIEYSDLNKYSVEHNTPILVYDLKKELIYATDPGIVQYGYKRWTGLVRTDNNIYLAINRSAVISNVPARVVIYSDIRKDLEQVQRVSWIILIVFAFFLFFSIISIILSGREIFEPISDMTRTVKDISEKKLNLRLNVSGSKSELRELALTFNEMMNRIEDYSNRQKQFVSDASHELRTPTSVIQGYAVMLDRWGKNDEGVLQESIGAIKNEAENMQELIDKLLFLARHDNSTFVMEKEEFSLTEMLQEVVRETEIIDSSHKLNHDITREVSVFADRNRLKQAVRIFLDNAIKYTPAEGEITVTLGKEGHYLAVGIKDTGVGMTGEELGHIFDRFYRADQSRAREKGGHGLGLAIARIIILGHNGKIKVKSKVGEGSEVIILLNEEG